MSQRNTKWTIAYVAIILANVVFGILFYYIGNIYGNR